MSAKRSPRKQRQHNLPVTLERALQQEIVGVLLIAIGSVTALTLLSVTKGALSATWVMFLRRIFGRGVYLVTLALLGGGLLVLWEDLRTRLSIPVRRVLGLEVLFLAFLGLSHWVAPPEQAFRLAEKGGGGGYIGWAISYLLIVALGRSASLLILVLLALGGLLLFLNLDWNDFGATISEVKTRLAHTASPVEPVEAPPAVLRERKARSKRPTKVPEPPQKVKPALTRGRLQRLDRRLPPLDLLNGGTDEAFGDADVRYKKQVIEETLASFGVPAQVVEMNVGPTITQFGVEPGFIEYTGSDGKVRRRKIKVSKIMALQDDLALALAAAPIRIEAPVPGRSVVGIEVPNDHVSLVGLRSVIESKAFRSIDSKLRIALGQDVSGQPVAADLGQMPHLLIAGATGSGKSVCISSIVACLLLNNTPDSVRLLMVDPKMVELTIFNGIPHLIAPVVISAEEAVRALRWIIVQMDERYRAFSRSGTRNTETYNQLAASRGEEQLPYIVVVIDELADLMIVAADEIERSICRIAQLARATGIHLVIATQRPSVDIVTGLIKANFPARISFAVTSQVDSRVILDTGGAEKLLGRGDMLYMASDSSKLLRLQGCFVSDAELERLVRFWRDKIDWIISPPEAPAPWSEVVLEDEDTDKLLAQAIELACGRKSISTSFIQRRLHIGYPRAARLVDLMEEQGIVGPAENAGRSREVLINEHDLHEGDHESFQ